MQLTEQMMQEKFLQQYLRTIPHKAEPEIIHFAKLTSGWESEIFALTLAYQEGEARKTSDLILKVVQGSQNKYKATLEYSNTRLLARAGYPVPQLFQISTKETEPGPYILMERIQGQDLNDALQAASSEAQRRELLSLFCSLLARLHTLDWKPFVPYPASYAQQDLFDVYLSVLNTPLLEHQVTIFQPVFAWLFEHKEEITSPSLAINHMDFHLGNVLLRTDGTPCVIDWGDIYIGDFRLDLGWTCLLAADWRELILAEYERSAGHPIEQFGFFEVIACLKGLITVFFSLQQQTDALGLHADVEPFLRQNGRRIQYICELLFRRTGIALPAIEQLIEHL